KCEEVENSVCDVIVLEKVHHARPITFHLFAGTDRAKDNLREALWLEQSESDASNDTTTFFEQHQGDVPWVKDQLADVVFAHTRQLVAVHILQTNQPKPLFTRKFAAVE